jgi:Acyl-protein synthetase, LuxE
VAGPQAALAAALDARILRAIEDWRNGAAFGEDAFDALALALFAHQVAHNEPYRRFAAAQGYGPERMPETWRAIPAVPASAFKDAVLTTFDPAEAELEFHTSGTTERRSGRHYMQRAALYDAALTAGFERFMLPHGERPAFFNFVPDPQERPHSSLGYMMRRVGRRFGRGEPHFYLHGDALDVAAFRHDLATAANDGTRACIAGTAFAFVALLDELGTQRLRSRHGSRILETGGFKGRTRRLERADLYGRLSVALGIDERDIVAEYGMTELTSQYYDAPSSRTQPIRIKAGPPWLRALVVGDDGNEVPFGETGLLRHVDLANRSSVIAIQTEDRGYAVAGGFVLIGRDEDAALRGCSLDQEDLLARSD